MSETRQFKARRHGEIFIDFGRFGKWIHRAGRRHAKWGTDGKMYRVPRGRASRIVDIAMTPTHWVITYEAQS